MTDDKVETARIEVERSRSQMLGTKVHERHCAAGSTYATGLNSYF